MRRKILQAALILMPAVANAQIITGASILNIGANTFVTAPGDIKLSSDIAGTGFLVLAGSSLQNLNGSGKKIPNLTVNNIANINMTGDIVIGSLATLTNGIVITNNNLLTILPGAAIQGYNNSRYICTCDTLGGDATLGGVQVTIPSATSLLVPVGTGLKYFNPITISNNSGPTEQYTVLANYKPVPGPAAASTLKATWSVTEATAGGNTIGLVLQWKSANEVAGFNRNAAKIVRSFNGGVAEKTGVLAAAGSNPYTLTGGAFTGVSLFGVTSDVNAFAASLPMAKADESKLATESISLYPTIVRDNRANLVIKAALGKKYTYIISDLNGKVLGKKDMDIWKGDNIVPLTLPNLASGLYIISIYEGSILKKAIKFVKG